LHAFRVKIYHFLLTFLGNAFLESVEVLESLYALRVVHHASLDTEFFAVKKVSNWHDGRARQVKRCRVAGICIHAGFEWYVGSQLDARRPFLDYSLVHTSISWTWVSRRSAQAVAAPRGLGDARMNASKVGVVVRSHGDVSRAWRVGI
jgi:hypothetical protein